MDLKLFLDRSEKAGRELSSPARVDRVESCVPIYDCRALERSFDHDADSRGLRDELAAILLTGPGVFVLKGIYESESVVDAASDVFEEIIERQKKGSSRAGDHFASPGQNDRVWNSLEKLCLRAPDVFLEYHGNKWIDLAARAWLGTGYQMTAQVNLVHPGGAAQEGHCDYHLGFMTESQVVSYPPHVHAMSSRLTLQGAVAHCDIDPENGATKLLPYSHLWPQNYTAFRSDEVRSVFEQRYVQLSLSKGDAIFFSPALLHAAGENRTDNSPRLVNLLQVSSAFGRAMESIDRAGMCKVLYDYIRRNSASLSDDQIAWAIASCAEGYPFPTNLDLDPPENGLAPASQQKLFIDALQQELSTDEFSAALDDWSAKRTVPERSRNSS